jgi:hypothetical protein
MSSDTFTIHVTNIERDKVEFLCFTSTAGGINDYAVTRSFALMIIEDGMPYPSGGKGTPLQLAMRKLAGSDTPRVWEQVFHKEHVAKFITKSTLVERIGIVKDEAAWKHGRFELENVKDYPLHKFVLHVQVTDPKWLEGLSKRARYGTTAFDAWWKDPTRQSARELAAIERKASIWQPPSTKGATKKEAAAEVAELVAVKGSAVKRGVKKTAAKKTAAKKTAAKKKNKVAAK